VRRSTEILRRYRSSTSTLAGRRESTDLRRIVLILSTTLLEEYQNREYRPTIERRVIAYVNQKLKDSNPNDSQPWLVSR
jgi:hypothetical protein